MAQDLRIGWVGFHAEGNAALAAMLEAGSRVEAVLTLTESEAAKRSGGASYEELCARHDVPLRRIRHINDPESIELLRSLSLDVVIVIGWSQIVGPEALATARLGMVGAHAAVLPHNRGSAPVNWAILRGETAGGNTLLWLNPGVDEGEIIDQATFPITPYDTCATVYDKVADSNREMILRLISRLKAGQRPSQPQPPSQDPLLPRRRPEHGQINWKKPSREVYDFVRALTRPYPGAFSWLEGRRYFVWDAALLPGEPYVSAAPGRMIGQVVSPHPGGACGQAVACGKGAVIVLELESPEGLVLKGPSLSDQAWEGKVWSNE